MIAGLTELFRVSRRLAGVPLVFAGAFVCGVALAQGKAPFYIDDTVVYGDRTFGATFSMFEREEVRPAPGTGAPQKEWIEVSSLSIHATNAADLGPEDRVLALRLSRAFCEHHGLTVNATPERSALTDTEWTFYSLCWKEGW